MVTRLCLASGLLASILAVTLPGQSQVLFSTSPVTSDAFEVRDMDLDGRPDIVGVTNQGGGSHAIGLSLQLPNGTFTPIALTPVADAVRETLLVANFNGQRLPGVACLRRASNVNRLVILTQTSPGTLAISGQYIVPTSAIGELVAGDFDRDGITDIAHWDLSTWTIWFGQPFGSAVFQAGPVWFGWPGTRDMRVMDMNGDGFPDLVGLNENAELLFVSWNDGQGGFGAWSAISTNPTVGANEPSTYEALDFDSDGDLDFLVLRFGRDLAWLENQGNGSFTESGRWFTQGGGQPVLLDDNRDGQMDVYLLGGTMFHRFGTNLVIDRVQPVDTGDYAITDLNLDGWSDIVVCRGPTYTWYPSPGSQFPGLDRVGTGTLGCRGRITLAGSRVPAVGTQDFALSVHNAPPDSLGFLAVSTGPNDPLGSDPLFLGAKFHIDINPGILVRPLSVTSTGQAVVAAPIPASPGLQGLRFSGQAVFFEQDPADRCSLSLKGTVTSNGLRVTVQ